MLKRLHAALALSLAFFAAPAPLPAQGAAQGQWQNGPVLPYFPVHMHLMRTGKLLMWPGDGGVSGNDPRMLDPVSGAVTPLAAPGYDIFCSGHSFLPDGRLFVAGGHISNNVGLAGTAIYDPLQNTWTKQPNMNAGRWYPTSQVLANGDVLTVAGDIDLTTGEDTTPQVWQAADGQWRTLTSAQIALGLYPTLSLAPNGKVFNSGPSVTTRYLDTNGTGAWTVVGNHIFQGIRDYDSMVMYQPGKILVVGGSDPATNTAEVIDLNAPTPAWHSTGSMSFARRQLNATMLPDGKVLVTGGTGGPGFSNDDPKLAVYPAELWDPATEQWTTLASATVPRLYHSIAMLLPDGRVLTTGGNSYLQTEYFSPPYLFAGPRPTISSAPTEVANGQQIFVGTPDARSITQVSWVRLPSVTHTLSMSQAFWSSTAITQAPGGISITAPNDPTMPGGFYMLFILNNGVPSVASILHLGPAASANPAPSVSSLSPSSIANGSSPTFVTVAGSSFTTDSAVVANGAALPSTFISASQLGAWIPAGYLAAPGTVSIAVSTPAPGGGMSASLPLSVVQAAVPNLTQTGTIIARIMNPKGGGNHDPEVIRDGDLPPVGSVDARREYDTYSGGAPAAEDWIGYQYASQQTFAQVVFQEGMKFVDGGWFAKGPNVQVRQNGAWVNVQNLAVSPAYPGNNQVNYETFNMTFSPITGDAIRIDGAPGGAAYFTSVGELQVFGPAVGAVAAPSVSSISPSTAYAGDPAVKLTVSGSGFSTYSVVQWNGASLPTSYGSATQLTAVVPVSLLAQAATAQISVSGGSGATFTVKQAPAPNLTQAGVIIARIMAPKGGGNHNPEVIRDGDLPPVGNGDSSREYDTYAGSAPAAEDWIGYQYASQQTFAGVLFQEGKNFVDGGWFQSLGVQVRQNGNWVNVQNLAVNPAYPANDNINYESYSFSFQPIAGDAIRIDGAPGGSASFISVGELQVFGPASVAASSAAAVSSLSPSSAYAGDPPTKLTLSGNNFTPGSVVQWNGASLPTAYLSATQLSATVPASLLLQAGTAQVSVGSGAGVAFSVQQPPAPNLTQTGTIIARILHPIGGGNHNPEVIRDGDLPPVGNGDSSREYDTYAGGAPAAEDWIGYQYASQQTFASVVFQEGKNFVDGGWFNSLAVQVRQNGTWVNVQNLAVIPAYPPNDNISYETYTFSFSPITGDAIRIDGAPGGSVFFISVGELQVFGPASAAAAFSSVAPGSATAGDPPLRITVSGSGFTPSSTVLWNGAPLSTTYGNPGSLTGLVPAAKLAAAGSALLSVSSASGTAAFTIKGAAVPNLTQTGAIIASVPNPLGSGSRNLEVIRDGDMPAPGTTAPLRQYDSWNGGGASGDAWIGYQYAGSQTFTKIIFQEGMNFNDGGWFNKLNVQVRQNGVWVSVSNLSLSPAYPPNDGVSFETYTLTFAPIAGDAIRINGAPGGSGYFISVGELQVFGQ